MPEKEGRAAIGQFANQHIALYCMHTTVGTVHPTGQHCNTAEQHTLSTEPSAGTATMPCRCARSCSARRWPAATTSSAISLYLRYQAAIQEQQAEGNLWLR